MFKLNSFSSSGSHGCCVVPFLQLEQPQFAGYLASYEMGLYVDSCLDVSVVIRLLIHSLFTFVLLHNCTETWRPSL